MISPDGYLTDSFLLAFRYFKILNTSHGCLESRLHLVTVSVPELPHDTSVILESSSWTYEKTVQALQQFGFLSYAYPSHLASEDLSLWFITSRVLNTIILRDVAVNLAFHLTCDLFFKDSFLVYAMKAIGKGAFTLFALLRILYYAALPRRSLTLLTVLVF